jgi:hypothetical protein
VSTALHSTAPPLNYCHYLTALSLSFHSHAHFCTDTWANDLIATMSKREVEPEELWKLRSQDEAILCGKKMEEEWKKELLKPVGQRSFKAALWRFMAHETYLVLLYAAIWTSTLESLASYSPLLLHHGHHVLLTITTLTSTPFVHFLSPHSLYDHRACCHGPWNLECLE